MINVVVGSIAQIDADSYVIPIDRSGIMSTGDLECQKQLMDFDIADRICREGGMLAFGDVLSYRRGNRVLILVVPTAENCENSQTDDVLRVCCAKAMQEVARIGVGSVVFPCFAHGALQYEDRKAAECVVNAVVESLTGREEDVTVYLTCNDLREKAIYEELITLKMDLSR